MQFNVNLHSIHVSFSDQSDSDDENEGNDQEYASLDSVPSDNSLQGGTFSPRSSEPPSLTESMHLMDEILSDKTMDRLKKIDKLEAILSAATLLPTDPVSICYCMYLVSDNNWICGICRSTRMPRMRSFRITTITEWT